MNINKNINMEIARLREIIAESEQTIDYDDRGNPIFPKMDEV